MKKKDKIYATLTTMYENEKSISRYREIINKPLHKNKINSVILYNEYLLTFSEDRTIKILDKNTFNFIQEINDEFDLPIFEAIKLKNQDIVVCYGNKIKIITFNEKEKKIHNKQIISNFTDSNITAALELDNGKILILSNGKLFCLKNIENTFQIFKKDINAKEFIYSMIELDENSFLITCELNKYKTNKSCHFQIYDSEDISLIHNSCQQFNFYKNKNNVCKFNSEFVFFCLDIISFSNKYEMLILNFKEKNVIGTLNVNMDNHQVYKIFDKSFIGVTNFNGKYTLNQIKIISISNYNFFISKYGYLTSYDEIVKTFIIDDMIILLDKNGKLIIYQIENQYLNIPELSLETKIKKRNEKIRNNINNCNNSKMEKERKQPPNQHEKKYYDLDMIEKMFNIMETGKDGNCLFDSLWKAENISSLKMRQILTDYLKKNYNKFEGFEQELNINNENIDNYINKMKNSYEYGTHTEICVYSSVFKKRVIIYMIDENGNGIGYNTIGDKNEKITNLLFISNSKNNESADHYKLLLEK